MADAPFAWQGLAQYKAEGRFLDGYDFMLKQIVGTNLDVTKLLAPTASAASPPLPPAPETQ